MANHEPFPRTVPGAVLGELGVREFLARHWQKSPLLVRGAVRDWKLPVTLENLIEFAGESEITSRLVSGPGQDSESSVRRGPLPADTFRGLPEVGWTLLIQEIDRRVEGFAELLDRFRFIPNWRVDDVMVSYAADGGGVGPHLDRYDVFLVQAAGTRRWRIESSPREEEHLRSDTELPVLSEFEPDREWILGPGDLLYLPPRVPHEGIAVGDCVTCSVGFRAPDPRELCAGFLLELGPDVFEGIRYTDPDLEQAGRLGEIPAGARKKLRESAIRLFSDAAEFDRWLGRFVTRPRRDDRPGERARVCGMDELRALLDRGGQLRRSAVPHFAWHREEDGTVQLSVGGENYGLAPGTESTADLLCGRERLDRTVLAPLLGSESFAGILHDLVLRGFLVPER